MSVGNARPPENEKSKTIVQYIQLLQKRRCRHSFFYINENFYKNNLCYTEANDFRLIIHIF